MTACLPLSRKYSPIAIEGPLVRISGVESDSEDDKWKNGWKAGGREGSNSASCLEGELAGVSVGAEVFLESTGRVEVAAARTTWMTSSRPDGSLASALLAGTGNGVFVVVLQRVLGILLAEGDGILRELADLVGASVATHQGTSVGDALGIDVFKLVGGQVLVTTDGFLESASTAEWRVLDVLADPREDVLPIHLFDVLGLHEEHASESRLERQEESSDARDITWTRYGCPAQETGVGDPVALTKGSTDHSG